MTVYYKVIEVWCKYPFQDVIEEKFCLFSFSRKKFRTIETLRVDSNTSIKEKEEYLKKELNLEKITVIKL